MTVTTRSLETTIREPLAFDERSRRVLELRKQVREGTYRTDPREIAGAILDEWIAAGEVIVADVDLPAVTSPAERREAAARFIVERTDAPQVSEAGARSA